MSTPVASPTDDQPTPRPRTRSKALVATGVAALLLAGGTVAWAATGTSVVLTVDGQPRQVRLHGNHVSDVLRAAGLKVGAHDLLVPAANRTVADGAHVALRHGRQLRLVVDGQARTVWVTADSVDEALAQAGLRAEGAALSASRSRPIGLDGLSLDVRLAKNITIVADGRTVPLVSAAQTVADALAEANIAVRPQDSLSVPAGSPLTEGLTVTVGRVDSRTEAEDVPVAYATVRQPDPAALVGTERVLQAGHAGSVHRTFTVTLVDGAVTGRTQVGEQQTAAAQDAVVAFGTKPRPAPAPVVAAPAPVGAAPAPPASAGGLNWAALASCESGGNPRAVNPSGSYFGLYQFSISTWAGVGGSGVPSNASAAEQTMRAQILYARTGRSSWPVCGRLL